MGNGPSGSSTRRYDNPRAVVESPIGNGEPSQRRVTFADRPSGIETIKVRPKMEAIGQFPDELYKSSRKVKFYRSQMATIGSNQDVRESMTSVRSAASAPVDGVWEPILDPYGSRSYSSLGIVSHRTRNAMQYETLDQRNDVSRNVGEYYYNIGQSVQNEVTNQTLRNGLPKVDEI